ncbi:MAG: 5'-methylthioadenosine/S-adenosylhomocysteine nucleosidase, partial [Clostridia bacterium]|nr:5'-methylthioadenosine/S-adenosylhomocysteine nucleosidase [Clostridia bacterium]
MLGIVCAMTSEAKPVLDLMTEVKSETFAKKQFYVGNLLGKKAVLCVSDIGKVNSSLGATICILKYGANVILNFGVVGAIDPQLKLGDVVVGTSAMQYDFDLSLPNGIDRGQLSNFNDKHIPLTQKYIDEFVKLGFKTGRLATTDAFKFNYDNWCYCRECDLLVEDMEMGAIAQV